MPVVALEQKANILKRLFSHKDYSPLIVLFDTVSQPSAPIVSEFIHHTPKNVRIMRVNLEHHHNHPALSPDEALKALCGDLGKEDVLIIIDNLSLIPDVAQVLPRVMRPNVSIVGVYHEDLPILPGYGPSLAALLGYMATTVLRAVPSEQAQLRLAEHPLSRFDFEKSRNNPVPLSMIHKRRSGRSVVARFRVDSSQHTSEIVTRKEESEPEDPSLLEGLTTFNLGVSDKQRKDRDQVPLPFLAAQEIGEGGAKGGAIIYEFEKDDDYDEEDPYEDPF